MRYALISDIHANRQAWQAVSRDIACCGVDAVICLGDIVGYGPAPAEVLESVYEQSDYFVLGNHDAVVAGRLDPECFNDQARKVIDWTCDQLGPQAVEFFNEVPFLLDAEGFSCAHADYAEPDVFDYIITPEDAIPSLNACPEPLLLVGHTHEPCVMQWTPDGRIQHRKPERLRFEPDWKYVVNVGSVGDPRDGDLRASYVILDLETQLESEAMAAWNELQKVNTAAIDPAGAQQVLGAIGEYHTRFGTTEFATSIATPLNELEDRARERTR